MPLASLPEESRCLSSVVNLARSAESHGSLGRPEVSAVSNAYLIREDDHPVARLYVEAGSELLTESQEQAFGLRLLIRGAPLGRDVEGVLRFMELGHRWAVRAFSNVVAQEVQAMWGPSS